MLSIQSWRSKEQAPDGYLAINDHFSGAIS